MLKNHLKFKESNDYSDVCSWKCILRQKIEKPRNSKSDNTSHKYEPISFRFYDIRVDNESFPFTECQ